MAVSRSPKDCDMQNLTNSFDKIGVRHAKVGVQPSPPIRPRMGSTAAAHAFLLGNPLYPNLQKPCYAGFCLHDSIHLLPLLNSSVGCLTCLASTTLDVQKPCGPGAPPWRPRLPGEFKPTVPNVAFWLKTNSVKPLICEDVC